MSSLQTGFRVILFFNQPAYGWTEEFYWTGPTNDFAAVLADAAALIANRRPCLSTQCTLLGARIAPFPNQDDASILAIGPLYSGDGGIVDAATPGANPIWDGILCELAEATYQSKRQFNLRGMPTQMLAFRPSDGGGLTPFGVNATVRFLTILRNQPLKGVSRRGTWCLKTLLRSGPDIGEQPITAISLSADGCGLAVSTPNPPAWAVGDLVNLHGIRGCSCNGLSGVARVVSVAGTLTTTTRYGCCCPPWVYRGYGGTIAKLLYQLQPIYAVSVSRVAERSTGRPFQTMTWAPTDVRTVAAHPCGTIMDWLRTGSRVSMQTWTTGGTATPVVWFRAPAGADTYTAPTVFRSRLYNEPYRAWSGIGEQMEVCWSRKPCSSQRDIIIARPWWDYGIPPAPYAGLMVCGSPHVFQFGGVLGSDPLFTTNVFGQCPECAIPTGIQLGSGGEREGGSARQWLADNQYAAGGEREGGMGSQGPPGYQAGMGGEAEGGSARQWLSDHQYAAGGEREGGTASQFLSPIQYALGGEREGGSAPQTTGYLQPAIGGEREGGTATQFLSPIQYALGGEAEGGSATQRTGYLQAAVGGEREGGTATQRTGQIQYATGGEREGGSARQFTGTIQTATGGEREGGVAQQLLCPAPYPNLLQIAVGGEREGGVAGQHTGQLQAGVGGEKEGGTSSQIVQYPAFWLSQTLPTAPPATLTALYASYTFVNSLWGPNALDMGEKVTGTQQSISFAPGTLNNPSTSTVLLAQFFSPLLAAQSLASGGWTVALAMAVTTSGTGQTWTPRIRLFLINGATGAIRTTILAATTIGAGNRTATAEVTCFAAGLTGAAATIHAGDYLVAEVSVTLILGSGGGATWAPTPGLFTEGTTMPVSDGAAISSAQSVFLSPQLLTLQ